MATVVADLVATIRADDQASGKLDSVGQKVASLGGTVEGVLGGAAKATGLGLTALGAAGAAWLGVEARGAIDFESSRDAVNAALGGVDQRVMGDLEQQALDLGQATKYSAGVVARGPLRRLAARERAGDRPARAGRDGRPGRAPRRGAGADRRPALAFAGRVKRGLARHLGHWALSAMLDLGVP